MKRFSLCALAFCAALPAWAAGPAVPAAGTATPPGGVYVGYYQEDPATNPEDPTMGSVYLNLPASDSSFSGTMYFTYFGCQSSNVGTVSGIKKAASLSGSWSGTLDGTQQKGSLEGAYSAAKGAYAGTFTVAGGKQHIDIPSCISYYIAPKGTFELFAVGQNAPSSFSVAIDGHDVRWTPPGGAMMTLVFVLDPAVASSGHGNATVWQTLVMGPQGSADLSDVQLVSGRPYVLAVSAADSKFRRLGFASKSFTAP
ncbi:hypothetical protein SAMN05216570_3831 [Dyella sp. OK004]|uniref:hypothetical protein n=1 Tax=Dyella sp. OK004 TaxID=1855292 RepID=UPI0008EEF7AB|nr:hypothetical protein [Dyella sp. OK004]SFS18846.1 hypothetical protein SAMN05216570_3831 [Dyella sp. OK004]